MGRYFKIIVIMEYKRDKNKRIYINKQPSNKNNESLLNKNYTVNNNILKERKDSLNTVNKSIEYINTAQLEELIFEKIKIPIKMMLSERSKILEENVKQ